MKARKTIALILALSLAVALIAGCGGDGGSSPAPANPAAPASPAPGGNNQQAPGTDAPPPPPSDNTVYRFNVSFSMPEFSAPEMIAVFDRIQEASNGRIEFTHYFSWSLTSVPTCIDDLNANLVDICVVPIHEHVNLFPLSSLITVTPFLGFDPFYVIGAMYDEMINEWPELAQEYTSNGVKYWTNIPMPAYNIYTTGNHNIRVPGDLRGLRLLSGTELARRFIQAQGGAPVFSPVTEYATSLNSGVVDGAVTHANLLRAVGSLDFIEAGTLFAEAGVHAAIMAWLFSQQAWDSLPADLQQLFTNEAEAMRDGHAQWDYNSHSGNIAAIEGEGGELIRLTYDEIKAWEDAFASLADEYIQELIGNGHTSAQAVYDAIKAKVDASR